MNFKLFFICVKSAVEILMAISLNLYIALGRLGILHNINSTAHEHRRSFQYTSVFFSPFLQRLKFSL